MTERPGTQTQRPGTQEVQTLADILERVLDKGIVIAGDIRVNLLDIELLTIKIRLLIASVDKAREMGIDWWEHDPTLSVGERNLVEENRALRLRIAALESETQGVETQGVDAQGVETQGVEAQGVEAQGGDAHPARKSSPSTERAR
jgi:hypothetical protein